MKTYTSEETKKITLYEHGEKVDELAANIVEFLNETLKDMENENVCIITEALHAAAESTLISYYEQRKMEIFTDVMLQAEKEVSTIN